MLQVLASLATARHLQAKQLKAGTRYLSGYTDPTGKQRSARTYRTRVQATRAGAAAERKVHAAAHGR